VSETKLRIERWPVEKLKPYPKNARRHPAKQIEKIADAIERHGFDQPIAVDKAGVVIKGHGRLLAAKRLGLETVPVVIRDDLSPAKVREARIADNRLAELSKWDDDVLDDDVDDAIEEFGDEFDVKALAFPDDHFDDEPSEDLTKSKKMKLKKHVTCPNCDHEFEA
jgi:hypothetical protein